jgi:hypothetical protein
MWLLRCIICWLLLLPGMVQGQFRNNNWVFGDSIGINFDNGISYFQAGSGFYRGTASISDSNGSLIFYGATGNETNSHTGLLQIGRLYNKNHFKLHNGDTLVGQEWYHDMLILPKSVVDSTFYVFVAGVTLPDTGLWYNVVDMKLQGGLGQVVQKNVLLEHHPVQDMLAAVRHGNGKDWWLITRRWTYAPGYVKNNEFWVYLVDSIGIYLQPVQFEGVSHFDNAGDMTINPVGDKLVLTGLGSHIGVFNFNRCTGAISNEVVVEMFDPPGSYFKAYFSGSFSPDGSKLYALSNQAIYDSTSKLYQFDLTAPDIAASRILIDTFTIDASPACMELAPDGKIYISSFYIGPGTNWPYPDTSCWNYINSNLSVINYPDNLGTACDFQPFSFYLNGSRTYFGLPNNPDYELGAWVGSPCDTLTTYLTPNPSPEARGAWMQAWYNNSWQLIQVNASKLLGKSGVLRILDVQGRLLSEQELEEIQGGYFTDEINTKEFKTGLVIVHLITDKEQLTQKVMIHSR